MENLLQDLRYAHRTLKKSPVFTAVAILSLALGIGANTAIFTLLDQVLVRLLPVKNPEQLVLLTWRGSHYGNNTGSNALSYPMYVDFRDQNQVFSGMLCRYGVPLSMSFNSQTERARGELVSGNYFDVLGVKAVLGRTFTPDDDRIPGGHPIAVLSWDFWKSRFAADPAILGKAISLNGYAMTVIGVSQPGFDGIDPLYPPQIRIPVMMKNQIAPSSFGYDLKSRRSRWVNVFARLKPGVTMTGAKASLQPIFHQILEMEVKEPAFNNTSPYTRDEFLKSTIDVLPGSKGRPQLREQLSTPLVALMAIVALVLLIACANVANLLIARAAGIRMALGAAGPNVIWLVMKEVVILVAVGIAVALPAAWGLTRLVQTQLYGLTPNDPLTVAGATIGLTAVALLAGYPPARRATRVDPIHVLRYE